MKRFTIRELLGIIMPLVAVAVFLFASASGEDRLIQSPLIIGVIAVSSATLCAALFGIVGALAAGVVLSAIALYTEAPLASAEAQVYVLPALAAWFSVGAVMIRRAMMRWRRRKHMDVGQEIERLRAKNIELQNLLNTSANVDALSLASDVWEKQLALLIVDAEALMIEVPAEVRAGDAFKNFANKVQGFQGVIDNVTRLVETSGMKVTSETALTEVASAAIADVQELADALSIDIEAVLQDDGVPCVVDVEEMRRGVANVLRNAIEATGRAGKVTIEVHSDYRNGRAMIEVTDRGPGMPSDVLAQVFKPFFTTRRDRMGLGLTVAREVVKRAGGSIALTSNEPRGMVVRIRLPIRRTQVSKEEPIASKELPLSNDKLQIKKGPRVQIKAEAPKEPITEASS